MTVDYEKGVTKMKQNEVSTAFKFNRQDAETLEQLLKYEATPEAIKFFDRVSNRLSDYAYWYGLSTLWVSYTGFSDLNLWKKLFSSNRPNKEISLMKPYELKVLKAIPNKIDVYRAIRQGETDCIAYTTDIDTVLKFAKERNSLEIEHGRVKKKDVLACFLRRGEYEVIVLDKCNVKIKSIFKPEELRTLRT